MRLIEKLPRQVRFWMGYATHADLPHFKLWQRLLWVGIVLEPVETEYRVVYEDPDDLEAPVKVMVPDAMWMACALRGGILPPVEAYHQLEYDEKGRIATGHILHETPPIGPLTEEQAIEYLIMKDVPPRVWRDYRGNRPILKICTTKQVPDERTLRNAWSIAA